MNTDNRCLECKDYELVQTLDRIIKSTDPLYFVCPNCGRCKCLFTLNGHTPTTRWFSSYKIAKATYRKLEKYKSFNHFI